ncbi:MAG: tRNA (adenosine(37)-N6)-threonylcarbamoyltransferase complex transferase subunit TsaD, partial [Hyphomonadaceae bacterium]|nr:tRNA (adenosine(37)-N6)-threonylcarbamoyltransferase complex transferase subunit TsaD [Hyphomonadaceae bacterium]
MALASRQREKQEPITILGIESSCDETAAAVLRRDRQRTEILSSIVATQLREHTPYGGIVPEIAARAHTAKIDTVIRAAVDEAGINYVDLDGVAATSGPGLIGGVITGLMCAKGLALALDIPLLAVNHLEGHALSPRLTEKNYAFPNLLLLVSGGHTQLIGVHGLGDYTRIGSTVDDALGEAFDKTAKVMGLGFPGGPKVENLAATGDAGTYDFPRPYSGTDHANFSLSGLKTAVARAFDSSDKSGQAKADICASFQQAVCDIIVDRIKNAIPIYRKQLKEPESSHRLVVAGGVAANQAIRSVLVDVCEQQNFR